MESDKLYRVKKEDLPKLEELLNICFAHDPLYETLIPDPDVRKRLMPELFHCDMWNSMKHVRFLRTARNLQRAGGIR